ncbi:MAG: site-2 protease family protein [Candidatus Nanoarchaeia archaeon]
MTDALKMRLNEKKQERSSLNNYVSFVFGIFILAVLGSYVVLSVLKSSEINNVFYSTVFFIASILATFAFMRIIKADIKEKDKFTLWLVLFLAYTFFVSFFISGVLIGKGKASVFIYDLIFLGLFSVLSGIFIYKRRHNLKREGIMYLYRTKVGMKFIDYVGEKYPKTLKVFSYLAIICGYALMVIMIFLLLQLVYIYVANQDAVRAVKVPPLMPLIPYLPSVFKISFLPPFYFTYWIVAIACIALFHEFAHGILMKRYGIKIKSTGFGFLGPFLAAFVEQDEKDMEKKGRFEQMAVLAAGTFTNLLLAILFFFVLFGFFSLAYSPNGAMFDAYTPGIVAIANITSIDGINVSEPTNASLIEVIEKNNIQNDLVLGEGTNKINFTKIIADNKTYYMTINELKSQLKQSKGYVLLYYDFPAIRNGLKGAIIEINGERIKTYSDLNSSLSKYEPGQEVSVKTKYNQEVIEYNLVLGEDPTVSGRAILGIATSAQDNSRLVVRIFNFFNFYKQDATLYEPRFNTEFTIFIYNLIWWLALVNLSVALANMIPMGMFDGGRFFMLTVESATKSKKAGEIAFKVATYIILGIFALLMLGWAFAIFI